MTEDRRSGVYARRRDLRVAPLPPPPPGTLAAWARETLDSPPPHRGAPPLERAPSYDPDAGSRGPTTADLELYRLDPALPARPGAAGRPLELPPELPPERPLELPLELPSRLAHERGPADRGERARAFVERWSLWAAGLGKPPRDTAGGRRYPGREGLLPPALLLAAGLGVAGLIGLLTGLLLNSSGGNAVAAAAPAPTVTVTQQVTLPAVTRTTTRTTTRTVADSPQAQAQAQDTNAGAVLRPGSQGPAVMQLQQDLAALGLYQGQPTGTYDGETRAGVRAFQGGFGVTGDRPGVAGPATLAAVAHAVGRA